MPVAREPDRIDLEIDNPPLAVGRRIWRIHGALDRIVQNADALFPPTQARRLRAAWADVEPTFGPEVDRLGSVELSDWAAAGLIGAQLALKLSLVDEAIDEVEDAWERYLETVRRFGRFGKRWSKKKVAGVVAAGLALADKVADSIPGMSEIITEFKGMVESGAELISQKG